MNYLDRVFNASYNKFLTAVDHVDYHPTSPDPDDNDPVLDDPSRVKRHAPNINVDTWRAVNLLKKLDEEDLTLLTSILGKVFCMHPHLNNMHHWQIWFGLMTWVLGWGVFANSQNIKHVKQNIRRLQEQNQQQDTQIKSLANHLNLTMAQVSRHEEMLFELDMNMCIMNQTLHVIMRSLSEIQYKNDLFNWCPTPDSWIACTMLCMHFKRWHWYLLQILMHLLSYPETNTCHDYT